MSIIFTDFLILFDVKKKYTVKFYVYSIRNVQWRRSCERLTGFTLSSHCVLIEVTLSSHCSPCTFRVRIWLDLQQVPLCWSKYIYAFKNTQLALLKPLRVACRWLRRIYVYGQWRYYPATLYPDVSRLVRMYCKKVQYCPLSIRSRV